MSLEETEEVAAPVLVGGAVARQDVRLSKEAGDLGGSYGGTGRWDYACEAGQSASMLDAQSKAVKLLENVTQHCWLLGGGWNVD